MDSRLDADSGLVRSRPHKSPSRDLPALAAEISQEVRAAEAAWRDALGHAIRAGEMLTEAKALVRHGEWLPWLAANFEFGQQRASEFMRVAKLPDPGNLPSLNAALRALKPDKTDVHYSSETPEQMRQALAELSPEQLNRVASVASDVLAGRAHARRAETHTTPTKRKPTKALNAYRHPESQAGKAAEKAEKILLQAVDRAESPEGMAFLTKAREIIHEHHLIIEVGVNPNV